MEAANITNVKLEEGQTGLWYFGQVGFVIGAKGSFLAVDPYLSDYVDQNCCQYVQWRRNYPAPIDPESLNMLHAVLCTHSHYDHADPWTLPNLAKANPNAKFIVPAPEAEAIAAYGIEKKRIIPAVAGTQIVIGAFTVMPVPAAHEVLHTDASGRYYELSYVIDDGNNRIFHGGDMCLYNGLVEKLENINVAILPINGRDAERNAKDIIGNMNCEEAVFLAKSIKAELLVPVHHDLYEVNKANPEDFVKAIKKIHPMQAYRFFTPGEGYIYRKK